MKNEKFLLDIQTKYGDIAKEILNAAIDAERTFKCKWPVITWFEIFFPGLYSLKALSITSN